MCGRGVEAILYASVGSNVKGATMASHLNPFAGAFCFGMSAITPVLVKHSSYLANGMSRLFPKSIKFSGAVVSRTIGKAVMPSTLKLFRGARMTGGVLVSFVIACIAVLLTNGAIHLVAVAAGAAIAVGLLFVIRFEIAEIAKHVNYANIGVSSIDKRPIVNLVTGIVFGAAVSVLIIVSTWTYSWELSIVVAGGYVLADLVLMRLAYGRLGSGASDVPEKVYAVPRLTEESGDDILPDVPKPVYGIIRAAPQDTQL
jgi:hypothetical protein